MLKLMRCLDDPVWVGPDSNRCALCPECGEKIYSHGEYGPTFVFREKGRRLVKEHIEKSHR
jgi:hypothetical protein